MRRTNHKTLVLALVLLGVMGGVDHAGADKVKTLSVGTWNANFLPTERGGNPWWPFSEAILNAITATDFDVLVLQEVWTEAHRDEIISAVGKKYRYHYAGSARNDEPPINCEFDGRHGDLEDRAREYIQCNIQNGINTASLIRPYPNPQPFACSVAALDIQLWGGDPENQQCLACLINSMQNLPYNQTAPFDAIPICKGIGGLFDPPLPLGGPRFTLDGVNGILILSKFPITEVSETDFNSWLINRKNIYATIRKTRFAFVHFGNDAIADLGFPGVETYGDIQIDHANDIIAHSPDVVIGDFNSGPDYQPEGYDTLINAGYRDLVQPQPFATFCPPSHKDWIQCINDGNVPKAIDHILVKQDAPATFTGTFADGVISLHIGVSATIVPPRGK